MTTEKFARAGVPSLVWPPCGCLATCWHCAGLHRPVEVLNEERSFVDRHGALLSASDHVLRERREARAGVHVTVYEQEDFGGRFEEDGSFRGTRWLTHSEWPEHDDEATILSSTPSTPSPEDVAALRRLVDDVLSRGEGGEGAPHRRGVATD